MHRSGSHLKLRLVPPSVYWHPLYYLRHDLRHDLLVLEDPLALVIHVPHDGLVLLTHTARSTPHPVAPLFVPPIKRESVCLGHPLAILNGNASESSKRHESPCCFTPHSAAVASIRCVVDNRRQDPIHPPNACEIGSCAEETVELSSPVQGLGPHDATTPGSQAA